MSHHPSPPSRAEPRVHALWRRRWARFTGSCFVRVIREVSRENMSVVFLVVRLDDGRLLGDGYVAGTGLGTGLGVVSDTRDVRRWRNWWSFAETHGCSDSAFVALVEVSSISTLWARSTGMRPSS